MSRVIEFEKKGFNFRVFLNENGRLVIETKGIEAFTNVYYQPQQGWYYEVLNEKFVKALAGKKMGRVHITHPSAEEAKRMVMEFEAERERRKFEKIEADYRSLTDETQIKFVKGTSHTFAFVDEKGISAHEHPEFKNAVELIVKSNIRISDVIGRGPDETDMGDYSITDYYHITYKEFKELVAKATEVLEQKKRESQEKTKKAEENIRAKFEEAKRTGKPVKIRQWTTSCNDANEECDLDVIVEYAMPDGSVKTERHHTW